jgi:hypothetical protein
LVQPGRTPTILWLARWLGGLRRPQGIPHTTTPRGDGWVGCKNSPSLRPLSRSFIVRSAGGAHAPKLASRLSLAGWVLAPIEPRVRSTQQTGKKSEKLFEGFSPSSFRSPVCEYWRDSPKGRGDGARARTARLGRRYKSRPRSLKEPTRANQRGKEAKRQRGNGNDYAVPYQSL